MLRSPLELTDKQKQFVESDGNVFLQACPGSGKTRCIVEYAKSVIQNGDLKGKGLAFLSFTNAAISELEERLASENILPNPRLPHYIGTFDSFLWTFLVQPFPLEGASSLLRVIPDIENLKIAPHPTMQTLPLNCFDADTGSAIDEKVRRLGFSRDTSRYSQKALEIRNSFRERGLLSFEQVRRIAYERIKDTSFSDMLKSILQARFKEFIIDEAQDCNPQDLEVLKWLTGTLEIPLKVVCDPHQSIYSFRGGVTEELFLFKREFNGEDQELTDSFRSSSNICKAVSTLVGPSHRGDGYNSHSSVSIENLPIHLIRYTGAVSAKIGGNYKEIISAHDLPLGSYPLISSTKDSANNATGTINVGGVKPSIRLANGVFDFFNSHDTRSQLEAIKAVHNVMLQIKDCIGEGCTYDQYLEESGLKENEYRPEVLYVISKLKFNDGESGEDWLARAKDLLEPLLPPESTRSISMILKNDRDLDLILSAEKSGSVYPATIHSVKGKEFPAICVVATSGNAKGILDYLQSIDFSKAEEARKFYVGASRAQRLLVIACPRSQATRMKEHLSSLGATVEVSDLT